VPAGRAQVGQHAHVERRGVDETDALLPGQWRQDVIHGRVHQVVAGVGQDGVHAGRFGYVAQDAQRVAGDAHKADLAGIFQLEHRRQRFGEDLFLAAILDVVDLKEVEVVGLQAGQALLYRAGDAPGREIKAGLPIFVITPSLGRQDDPLAAAAERLAQVGFGQRPAVIGRHVEKVDAPLDGVVDGPLALPGVNRLEFVAQGRRPVAGDGDLEPRLA
jgi:hypothetical protein